MSTICRIYRIYAGSGDCKQDETRQASLKTKESDKPDIDRTGSETGSERDADRGRTDRNFEADITNRNYESGKDMSNRRTDRNFEADITNWNYESGKDMSSRRTDRNSAGFTSKEISRIGYEFLPCAAMDFLAKDDADTFRRAAATGIETETDIPGTGPEDLNFEIARGEYGKPYFPHHPELHFNISNSGDWIFMVLAGVRVGIDIQIITDIPLERIAKHVFAPDEYDSFLKMDGQREYFFREWVLRESYIKWTGEGLGRDMRSLPDDAWQALIPAPDGYKAAITAAVPLVCVDTEVQYDRQKGFIWTK